MIDVRVVNVLFGDESNQEGPLTCSRSANKHTATTHELAYLGLAPRAFAGGSAHVP